MAFDGGSYDVIVVGAGHAGVESALAAARMGSKTLMITINLDMVAFMPCNPSIGDRLKDMSCAKLMRLAVRWDGISIRRLFR